MWKFGLVLGLALMLLGGCSVLESVLGPSTNPDGTQGPSLVQNLSLIAQPWFPWATSLAGAVTTLYSAIRGYGKDNWKKFAAVTADGVEEWLKAHPDQEKFFKEFLATHHEAAGIYNFAKSYVEKFDH